MNRKRIEDLSNVETEHLLGAIGGKGLVKLRAESADTVLVGQMTPAQARDIAAHLYESAARAEYEEDLANECAAAGFDDGVLGALLTMVRLGEQRRHEGSA